MKVTDWGMIYCCGDDLLLNITF